MSVGGFGGEEMIALFIVLAAVFIVIVAIASQEKSTRSIDLTSVRDAMVSRHGWTPERADAARGEYLKFLAILRKKPDFPVVPWLTDGRDDLDQFWHQHILDTAKYSRDCHYLFGKLVHHDPHLKKGSKEELSAAQRTQAAYVDSCGGVIEGSAPGHHCDSSHSDSSHSCSTHSCSSHSCGGHGCGGGH